MGLTRADSVDQPTASIAAQGDSAANPEPAASPVQRYEQLGQALLREAEQVPAQPSDGWVDPRRARTPWVEVLRDRPDYPCVHLELPGETRSMRLSIWVTLGHVGEAGSQNNLPLDIEVNGGDPQLTWMPGQPPVLRGWFPEDYATHEPDLRYTPLAPADPAVRRVLARLEALVGDVPWEPSDKKLVAFERMLRSLFELARSA